jgi:predicted DNA-binding antitoxin AbrB/MazE fold protein
MKMSIVTAVYERGMLRLLQPVTLDERQKVRIQLLPEDSADMVDEVLQALIATGLLTAPSDRSNAEPLSEAKRQDLADRLGSLPGRPLSEIIIEERGPR